VEHLGVEPDKVVDSANFIDETAVLHSMAESAQTPGRCFRYSRKAIATGPKS
jgi:hypothetical protein